MNAHLQLFIWKQIVYKQMRRGIVMGKESALGAWRVALIKSLIQFKVFNGLKIKLKL